MPKGSLMEGLVEFATSIPDFRRTNKVNIRHKLSDIILLMVMAQVAGYLPRHLIHKR